MRRVYMSLRDEGPYQNETKINKVVGGMKDESPHCAYIIDIRRSQGEVWDVCRRIAAIN